MKPKAEEPCGSSQNNLQSQEALLLLQLRLPCRPMLEEIKQECLRHPKPATAQFRQTNVSGRKRHCSRIAHALIHESIPRKPRGDENPASRQRPIAQACFLIGTQLMPQLPCFNSWTNAVQSLCTDYHCSMPHPPDGTHTMPCIQKAPCIHLFVFVKPTRPSLGALPLRSWATTAACLLYHDCSLARRASNPAACCCRAASAASARPEAARNSRLNGQNIWWGQRGGPSLGDEGQQAVIADMGLVSAYASTLRWPLRR